MKRKTRIIQISGIRGLLMAAFIGVCLAAGFVAFPGYAAMKTWNYLASFELMGNIIPAIALYQGVILWAIFAGLCYAINDKKKYLVAMKNSHEITDEEIKKILDNIKVQAQTQTINSMLVKPENIEKEINKIEKEAEQEKEKVNQ